MCGEVVLDRLVPHRGLSKEAKARDTSSRSNSSTCQPHNRTTFSALLKRYVDVSYIYGPLIASTTLGFHDVSLTSKYTEALADLESDPLNPIV